MSSPTGDDSLLAMAIGAAAAKRLREAESERDTAERGAKALRLELEAARTERDEALVLAKRLSEEEYLATVGREGARESLTPMGKIVVGLRAELAKMTAQRDAYATDLLEEQRAHTATVALHEKALEATRAELARTRDAHDVDGKALMGVMARCAMLTAHCAHDFKCTRERWLTDYSKGRGPHPGGASEECDCYLAAPDAGVAEWLEKHDAQVVASHCARLALNGFLLSDDIAAHDAQVEAKALEKAAQRCDEWAAPSDGQGASVAAAIARELRALAGKDGTTP